MHNKNRTRYHPNSALLFTALVIMIISCAVSALCAEPALKDMSFIPQWTPQAQFAGYYVAFEKGIYRKYGINLAIKTGGIWTNFWLQGNVNGVTCARPISRGQNFREPSLPEQCFPMRTSPAQTSPAQTSPAPFCPARTSPAQTSPALTCAVHIFTAPIFRHELLAISYNLIFLPFLT